MKRFVKTAILLTCIVLLCAAARFEAFTAFAVNEKEKPIYVGMGECVQCHPEHVKAYSEWKYSRNFRILEMRGRDRDPQCLPCHTTGYGKPGGFETVDNTPHMKNVQCEACHGPASLHVKAPTVEEHQRTLSIPRNICTSCHYQHKHMGY